MQEVLEKMEASARVLPLLHHYPVSTEPEEMWEHGNAMLGFDAEERMECAGAADCAHMGGNAARQFAIGPGREPPA